MSLMNIDVFKLDGNCLSNNKLLIESILLRYKRMVLNISDSIISG